PVSDGWVRSGHQANGHNSAIIQVGATYNDLGAATTGVETSPVQIDTSGAATDTIDYVATNQYGLTSTTTRTVIILPAQPGDAPASPIAPPDSATSTPAISDDPATTTSAMNTATTTDATTTAQ